MVALKRRIAETLVIETFTTADDLAFKIATSLGRYILTKRVTQALEAIPGRDRVTNPEGRTQVARRVARLSRLTSGARLLLVNDRPEEMKGPVELCLLKAAPFDVVVSDMARDSIQDEGLRFLHAARKAGIHRPTIFTVGRYEPERGVPPYAFGITSRVDELLNLVLDVVERLRG